MKRLIFPIIWAALGIAATIGATKYGLGSFKEPGSGLFPALAGLGLAITSLVDGVQRFRREEGVTNEEGEQNKSLVRVAGVALGLVLWIVLLRSIGFILMTFITTVIIAKVLDMKGWIKSVVMGILVTVSLYLLFEVWLYTDLPVGILG